MGGIEYGENLGRSVVEALGDFSGRYMYQEGVLG